MVGKTPDNIKVSNTQLQRSGGDAVVTGNIENAGDQLLEEVEVQVTLLDDNDEIIGQFFHDTEQAEMESLDAGAGTSPFLSRRKISKMPRRIESTSTRTSTRTSISTSVRKPRQPLGNSLHLRGVRELTARRNGRLSVDTISVQTQMTNRRVIWHTAGG
jgi:hypothetical protein